MVRALTSTMPMCSSRALPTRSVERLVVMKVTGAVMTGTSAAMRVLVVEDDPDIADVLTIVFKGFGHHCQTAGSGAAGLAAASSVRPDIVFIDLCLPDMTGVEVASRLRDDPLYGTPYVVAMTGFSPDASKGRGLAATFDEYLVKPVEAWALSETVARAQEWRRLAVR